MKEVLAKDLQDFIKMLLPEKTPLEEEILAYATEHHVSIVEEEVANFLTTITGIKRPQKVLEIGTGLAYSTMAMAKALPDSAEILSIELLPGRKEKAQEFVNKSPYSDKIKLICGDGREIVDQINEKYDLVFLDAAKGQYPKFFEKFDQILQEDGIIIADNVLINGWVVNMEYPERRKRTMVVNMRNFLEDFKNKKDYEMTLIPLGDGLAIIKKKVRD